MKRTAVIALVVGLAACGDNLVDPHVGHSGARLKLVRYAYDGEPIEIDRTRFFDSELKQFCAIQTWSDGAHYCTPPISEAVYTNELCTKAIGVGLGLEPPPYFATFYELGGTSSVSALYRNLTSAEAPARLWRKTELGCVGPFFPEEGDGHHYYVVGGPLPVDDLRVKLTTPSDRERLGELFATTEDGLVLATAIHDNQLELDCQLDVRPNAPATECVPSQLDGSITHYTDASCTEPVMLSFGTPSVAASIRAGTSCVDYYAPTDEVTPAAVYERIGEQCVLDALPAGTRAFGIQRIEPASLAREPSGTGRVQEIRIGELSLADTLLHDAQLAADCHRVALSDGEERCIPTSTGSLTTLFSDDTCATEVPIALVPERECDVTGPYVSGNDIHAIGEPYPGELFELTTGDRCRTFVPPAGYVMHGVGPALPREQFPLATLVIDP
ncbi:MAG: hypothetical protein HOV81_34280 [Kofleriaceae bacterium]|nr:hypothetical protein [Kofleriaceae bacterium]